MLYPGMAARAVLDGRKLCAPGLLSGYSEPATQALRKERTSCYDQFGHALREAISERV